MNVYFAPDWTERRDQERHSGPADVSEHPFELVFRWFLERVAGELYRILSNLDYGQKDLEGSLTRIAMYKESPEDMAIAFFNVDGLMS